MRLLLQTPLEQFDERVSGRMTAKSATSGSMEDRQRLSKASAGGVSRSKSRSRRAPSQPKSTSPRSTKSRLKPDVMASESLIPSSLRSIYAAGCFGLFLLGGLVWANLTELDLKSLGAVANPSDGSGFRYLSAATLLFTAQLAVVIAWYRSRNPKVPRSRCFFWMCGAVFFALNSVSLGAGIHRPIASWLFELSPIYCWRAETWYWLVPNTLAALAGYQLLSNELRSSVASRWMGRFTLLVGASVAALYAGADLSVPPEFRDLSCVTALAAWHVLCCLTLLVYARYIVHIELLPAAARPSLIETIRTRIRNQREALQAAISNRIQTFHQRRQERREARALLKEERLAAAKKRADEKREAAELKQMEREEKLQAAAKAKQEKRDAALAEAQRKKEAAQAEAERKREEREAAKQQKIEAAEKLKESKAASPTVTASKREAAPSTPAPTTPTPQRSEPTRQSRTDQPEAVPASHYSEHSGYHDDEDDDDGEGRMSRKDLKRQRKLERQRARMQ